MEEQSRIAKPVYKKVAFARSTWQKAKAFNEGVEALASKVPLVHIREYLICGAKLPGVEETVFEEADRLQEVRKSGITAEMHYAAAQARLNFARFPEEAARVVAGFGPDGLALEEARLAVERALVRDCEDEDGPRDASLRLLVGEEGITAEAIRPGFSAEVYAFAPSLKIYEQFLWFALGEFDEQRGTAPANKG